MIDLPIEFTERMRNMLDDYDAFISAYDKPTVRAIRLNKLKYTDEKLRKAFGDSISPIDAVDGGYIYHGDDKIGNHPLHHAGAFYVQEPGAMAVVACAPIEDGMKILDLCASPGGKTTHAASELLDSGIVVSNEFVKSRCATLLSNIERMGIKNSIVMNCDTKYFADSYVTVFDLVIADAPCSGEGMFRKSTDALEMWSQENVEMCAKRQREILENGAKCVKNGGFLLYSTCTFSPEENELTVDAFLGDHPDFKLVRVPSAIESISRDGVRFEGITCENIEFARRFYPHVFPCEGQFAALMQKCADGDGEFINPRNVFDEKSPENIKITPADKKVIDEFLSETLGKGGQDLKYVMRRDGVYIVSDALPILKNNVFSCGVKLGEIQKGRLCPHHRFFMAYGELFLQKIELGLDDARVAKYLRGEQIPAPDNVKGFCVVLCDGAVMGGAKVSGGVAKNHYPKGLRKV